ncbi:hypothetical protein BGX38DRAFT_527677 [Terfezia claveryi]|nr:hypothetical protein BGX38DRAFT_527677 [Terfezia claveryi]
MRGCTGHGARLIGSGALCLMPGRLESRPLRVSQRSNALHFYHSAVNSSDQYPSRSRSYFLYTDPRPTPVSDSAKKQYGQQSAPTAPRHRVVSSLVTPFLGSQAKGKRASGSIKKQERNTVSRLNSSSASIRSFASSVLSRKRRYAAPPTLETLPSEILTQIFSYLGQKTLHNLIFCSKRMLEEASYNLYESPNFKTTYRFAQFVTAITHDRHRAWMVKELDVSNLGKEAGENETPLAGWREWKFRSDPLHTIHRDDIGLSKSGKGEIVKSLHPPPSPFLQRYSLIRDIPIGAIIHVLAACPFLRKIDLSNVSLAADYFISKLGSHRTGYHPTTFTSLLFVSDVPKSFTWQEGDTRPLSCSIDLVNAFTNLHGLKHINLRGGVWVTRDVAERIVEGSKAVQFMDLRKCGMYRERKWTVTGGRMEIGRLIVEEKEAEQERERLMKEAEASRRRLAGVS